MIRISNISFFRFCWENGKLDWPKCARTEIKRKSSLMFDIADAVKLSYGRELS